MKSTKQTRILVVGPNWVGDMVMAQSLLIVLKQRDPDCLIDVLAPAWTRPLLAHMPEVATAIEIPLRRGELGIRKRYRFARMLAHNAYDRAILLPNSLTSALIPFFAGIPVRSGYLGEQRWGLLTDIRRLDKVLLPQTVQRFVALGLDPDATLPPHCPEPRLLVEATEIAQVREKFALESDSAKVLGLCPGAEYGPAKRWPERHYAALARARIEQGWSVWLFGSAHDRQICARIDQASGARCRNFAGLTSLNEAIALLSVTDQVVTNDSGLMHIAAALGKNLIALYGSSDPNFTPPLTRKARMIRLKLPCSPCFKRECPLGHFRCMNDIDPQRVITGLDEAEIA
ncbi:MAG: lipopolysaccharide heptosyltransferase II [Methylococcales bacterium]